LISIVKREKFGDHMWDVPVGLARPSFVAGITSLLSNWTLNEEISNISNLGWMKWINNYFILLIEVSDMGEKGPEKIRRLWSQKKRASIMSCYKFWWTEHADPEVIIGFLRIAEIQCQTIVSPSIPCLPAQ
jgi:hypothetical protein